MPGCPVVRGRIATAVSLFFLFASLAFSPAALAGQECELYRRGAEFTELAGRFDQLFGDMSSPARSVRSLSRDLLPHTADDRPQQATALLMSALLAWQTDRPFLAAGGYSEFLERQPECRDRAERQRRKLWASLYNSGVQRFQRGDTLGARSFFQRASRVRVDAKTLNNTAALWGRAGETLRSVPFAAAVLIWGEDAEQAEMALRLLAHASTKEEVPVELGRAAADLYLERFGREDLSSSGKVLDWMLAQELAGGEAAEQLLELETSLFEEGDFAPAQGAARLAEILAPDSPEPLRRQARTLPLLHDLESLEAVLAKARFRFPDDPDLASHRSGLAQYREHRRETRQAFLDLLHEAEVARLEREAEAERSRLRRAAMANRSVDDDCSGPLGAGEMLGAVAGVLSGQDADAAMDQARNCGGDGGSTLDQITESLERVNRRLERESRASEAEYQRTVARLQRQAEQELRRREEAERRERERAAADRRRQQAGSSGRDGGMPTMGDGPRVGPTPEERRQAELREQRRREEAARRQREAERQRAEEQRRRRQEEERLRKAEEERRASYPPACRNIETRRPGIEGDFTWVLERCLSAHALMDHSRRVVITLHDACEVQRGNEVEFVFDPEGLFRQGNVWTGAWIGEPLRYTGGGQVSGETIGSIHHRFSDLSRRPRRIVLNYDTRRHPEGEMPFYWKITRPDGSYEYRNVRVNFTRSGAYDFRGNYTRNVPGCR